MRSHDSNLYQVSENSYTYRFSANNQNEYIYDLTKKNDNTYKLKIADKIINNNLLDPLMRALKTDKLVVSELTIDFNYPCDPSHNATILQFLADELPNNQLTSLHLLNSKKLEMQSGLMDFFKALEVNHSLKSLQITNCGFTD